MYAVIATDGKQYRVAKGHVLELEGVKEQVGQLVHFDKILLFKRDEQVTIGTPYVDKVRVIGKVIDHVRGQKIRILKFKRRKHHMKRLGYRPHFARVEILAIEHQNQQNKHTNATAQNQPKQKADCQTKQQTDKTRQQIPQQNKATLPPSATEKTSKTTNNTNKTKQATTQTKTTPRNKITTTKDKTDQTVK